MTNDSEARKHYLRILSSRGSAAERREDARAEAVSRRPMGFRVTTTKLFQQPYGVPGPYWIPDEADDGE